MSKNWTAAIFLSSVMFTTPLSACSNGSKPDETKTVPPAETKANASEKSGKTTVTVSVLVKDQFLQEAERLFEAANPDIDIDIRGYLATPAGDNKRVMINNGQQQNNNGADLEKYRTSINAELMSGKGADLIALENLPYGKYVDKKLLAGLDDMIKKDSSFPISEYYTGVFDSLKMNGKTYVLPIHFKMNTTWGNAPLLEAKGIKIDDAGWTWKDMLDIGRQAVQSGGGATAVWTGKPKTELVTDIVKGQYGKLVTGKKAAFDSPEFIGLLEQIGDMYEKGLIVEQPDMSNEHKDVFKSMTMQMPTQLLFTPQMMYGGKGKVYGTPTEGGQSGGGGVSVSSDLMFGINEKSKSKAEAWKFLAFLLSKDVQSLPMMASFAVHKPSLEMQLKQSVEMLKSGKIKLQGPNGAAPTADIDEKQLQSVMQFAEKADRYAGGDPNVMKIVKEEAAAFFNKTKTAKAAATMMQNRVTTYLNE